MPVLDAIHWGPASKATPKQLVILCHGFGADAYDLIDIAPTWGHTLPDAIFASVQAPEEHPSGFGRQWWSIGYRQPEVMEAGARNAAKHLDAFIDAELARLNLPPDAYALMGFSQGAMTVLFTGLRRAVPPKAILAFSGALIAPESLESELANRAPVLLAHGEADGQVPVDWCRHGEAELKRLNIPVETAYSPGLGHGIDDHGIAMAALTLQKAFA
jgi:phospholipase/carboxylesterase